MKEQQKLGFFQKMFLAITDFRLFPYILRTEKLSKSFGYFITFLLLLTTIISIYFSSNLFIQIDNFIANYNEIMPEFILVDGNLDITENKVMKLDESIALIIDTSYTYEEYISSDNHNENTRYDTRIFVNSNSITYENYDGSGIQLKLDEIHENYNKNTFYNHIVDLYSSPISKLSIFGIVFIGILLGYTLIKFLEIILIALIVSLLCVILGVKLDKKNYFKIAIYVMTLPYLIELISILVVGSIKEYAAIATILLAYVYIFYAIRAVKLDAFLLIINGKNKQKNGELKTEGKQDDKQETSLNEEIEKENQKDNKQNDDESQSNTDEQKDETNNEK